MATWDDSAPWRQGHVLPVEATVDLAIIDPIMPQMTVAIVISHDCDLAQPPESEPFVEIIVGRYLDSIDGNFTHAKSTRFLHLTATAGAEKRIIEIASAAKLNLEKSSLANFSPHSEILLLPEERSVLQRWLAARYYRSAFADEFNRRLKTSGMEDDFRKILKKNGEHLIAIFFDMDNGAEIERSAPEETYDLSITLVFNSGDDPSIAEVAAQEAADKITDAFRKRCFKSGAWQNIELQSCEIMSDEAITLRQSMLAKTWRLDDISLKGNPQQVMIGPS
jgi:hypothetical protein